MVSAFLCLSVGRYPLDATLYFLASRLCLFPQMVNIFWAVFFFFILPINLNHALLPLSISVVLLVVSAFISLYGGGDFVCMRGVIF